MNKEELLDELWIEYTYKFRALVEDNFGHSNFVGNFLNLEFNDMLSDILTHAESICDNTYIE
jgi:hypothetical protein